MGLDGDVIQIYHGKDYIYLEPGWYLLYLPVSNRLIKMYHEDFEILFKEDKNETGGL